IEVSGGDGAIRIIYDAMLANVASAGVVRSAFSLSPAISCFELLSEVKHLAQAVTDIRRTAQSKVARLVFKSEKGRKEECNPYWSFLERQRNWGIRLSGVSCLASPTGFEPVLSP